MPVATYTNGVIRLKFPTPTNVILPLGAKLVCTMGGPAGGEYEAAGCVDTTLAGCSLVILIRFPN